MKLSSLNIITLIFVVASFVFSTMIYPFFPETIISHWDAQGIANGYSGKFVGLFLVPIISLAIFLLFLLIPKIDPLKENIKKFRKYYDWFILLVVVYMLFIHVITILVNSGLKINFLFFLLPAMGILFFFIGMLLEKTKRNWFIGIRTPWTLSNDLVWKKTHKLGGILFKLTGFLAIVGLFFIKYAMWFILIPIFLSVIILTIYSYLEYRRIKK